VESLRGLALMLDGRTAEAIAAFDKALALDGTLHAARLNRAVAQLRSGQPAKALADLETIWKDESSPLRAQAAYHQGIALDRLGRAADAEAWLSRAIELDSSLDAALLYLGHLREQRGDVEGAARHYLDYLKTHPQSAGAMLRLGIAAQKAGRTDVAKLYLERVLQTDPDGAEAVEARKYLVMWE
jgi:tetratricopeptide (TPR) repeat protein